MGGTPGEPGTITTREVVLRSRVERMLDVGRGSVNFPFSSTSVTE